MIFRKEHGPANVATVVEWMSRYTVIFRNNDRRSRPLMNRLIDLLSPPAPGCPAEPDLRPGSGIRLLARA